MERAVQAWIKGVANVGPEEKQLKVSFKQDTSGSCHDWLPDEITYDGVIVTLDFLEERLGTSTAHSAIDRALDNAWSKL